MRTLFEPKLKTLLASCICLTLSACASNQGYISKDTGRALEEGLAKQIVDPTPAQGAPSVTPEVADAAIQRYLDGEVKEISEDADSIRSGE